MNALRSTPLGAPRGRDALHLLGGKWQVERCIGKGGSAAVYLALHHNNGRRAAIKVLSPAFADSAAARARFYHEARTANRVCHHGVVSVLDDGTTPDGRPFLVMELLEGRTLDVRRKECPSGRLSAQETITIVLDILETLAHAHGRGVVHRDLTPANVFLTRRDGVKLLGFGASAETEVPNHGSVTRLEASPGTMLHAAPEQTNGSGVAHPTADVWACGVLLYLLMTGEYPFPFIEKTSYLAACARGAARVDTKVSGVPQGVANVVARALASDPLKRFADARVMRAALEEAHAHAQSRTVRAWAVPVGASVPTQQSAVRRKTPAPTSTWIGSNELAWLLVATLLTVAMFAPFLRL